MASYKTTKEWEKAISAQKDEGKREALEQEYAKWQDFGGEKQIALPGSVDQSKLKPQKFGNWGDARKYLESLVPEIQADLGSKDRQSYESEKERLTRLAGSQHASAEDKRKAELLLRDLDNDYRDTQLDWLSEDLRNAKSTEDASEISAEIDKLKRTELAEDPKNQMVNDLLTGGTGFGDAGGWDGRLENWKGHEFGTAFGNLMNKEWNDVPLEDAYDQVGEQILDNTKIRNQQQLDFYDQGANRSIAGLRDANNKATQTTNDAIAALEGSGAATKDEIDQLINQLTGKQKATDKKANASLDRVTADHGKFTSERDASTKQYLDELAPLQEKLKAQGYEGIETSADDISRMLDSYAGLKDAAQNGTKRLEDVYGRYQEISDPTMTAKERAIMDAAQRSFARKDKSARDASMRDLAARGILSGGNLISNQAASQQQLGDERVAGMIAAQGSAVDRALQGLAGMRGTAGDIGTLKNQAAANQMTGANQIRTGNDAMAQFNKNQQGITQRFQDEYAQAEQQRLQKLAQDKQDTILNKTTGDFDASSQLNRDTQDALDRTFGRQTQTTNTGLTGAQNKYSIDAGLTSEKTSAADREANRASNLGNTELTNVTNRTNLIGSTGDKEDEALKYLLGLKSEKAALRNAGGSL